MIREIPRETATTSRLGEWIDGLIATFSPAWAASRALARVQAEELSSFRTQRRSRIDPAAGRPGRADWHLDGTYERIQMIEDARDLERNNVIARGLLDRATDNVVGCGFRQQATTNSPKWNDRAEKLWKEWADFECDVRNLSTFDELLQLTHRSKLREGDVGTILLADGKLQHFEADQLASPTGAALRSNMVDGVELDRRGRPITFHLVAAPDPLRPSVRHQRTTAVPAEFVVFLAKRQRHGQTRGLTEFSSCGWYLDQIDRNIEAVTMAARMAACIGLVHKTQERKSGLAEDENGRRKLTFQPGMLHEVGYQDSIEQIKQDQPGTNWGDFLAVLGRLVGIAFGLPLELTFLDFSRTNYSSARAALLQAYQVWLKDQAALRFYCSRIYRWKVIRWVDEGLLPYRADALSHNWICPGWKWLDPEKEISAQLASVDAGFSTLAEVAAQQGKDFFELAIARKAEIDELKRLGIPEVRSRITRDPGAPVSVNAQEPGEDEGDQKQAA